MLVSPLQKRVGYDIIVHGIGPYLTKYLREISTRAKGGELIVKNEPGALRLTVWYITPNRQFGRVVHATSIIIKETTGQISPRAPKIGEHNGEIYYEDWD